MNFKIWFENFDTPTNFLLNPENSNKTWDELENEFEQSGGKILGYGKHAAVFFHPKWNYILKKYDGDSFYTAFVRFAYKNPHPSFPKFFGLPKKIIPQYRRYKSSAIAYIIRIEKLEPLEKEVFTVINNLYWRGISYLKNKDWEDTNWDYGIDRFGRHDIRDDYYGPKQGIEPKKIQVKHFQDIIDAIKLNPALLSVFEGLNILQNSNLKGALDMHEGNFMKRLNGEIVILDPFWEGSNPYADALHARNMETDAYADMYGDDNPPDLMGGKLPKKKRIKPYKPTIHKYDPNDDVPF